MRTLTVCSVRSRWLRGNSRECVDFGDARGHCTGRDFHAIGGLFRAQPDGSVGGAGLVATLGNDPAERHKDHAVQPCGSYGMIDWPDVLGHG